MKTGCLGDFEFWVYDENVRTFDNLKKSRSAKTATHDRASAGTLLEWTGSDIDTVTFTVYLMAYGDLASYSTSVGGITAALKKLDNYIEEGTIVPLVIGHTAYGRYRWLLTGCSVDVEAYDKYGEPISATVSLTVKEYLKT